MRIELTSQQREALSKVTYLEIDIDKSISERIQVLVESVPKADPVCLDVGLRIKDANVRPATDRWQEGGNAMIGHCLAAVQLVKAGRWTVDRMEQWLQACQTLGNFEFMEGAVEEAAAKMEG